MGGTDGKRGLLHCCVHFDIGKRGRFASLRVVEAFLLELGAELAHLALDVSQHINLLGEGNLNG